MIVPGRTEPHEEAYSCQGPHVTVELVWGHKYLISPTDKARVEMLNWTWSGRGTSAKCRILGDHRARRSVTIGQWIMGTSGQDGHVLTKDRDAHHMCRRNIYLSDVSKSGGDNHSTSWGSGRSGYIGVYLRRRRGRNKYIVKIQDHLIGSFDDKEDAAIAYDKEAYMRYGSRAILNFPRG